VEVLLADFLGQTGGVELLLDTALHPYELDLDSVPLQVTSDLVEPRIASSGEITSTTATPGVARRNGDCSACRPLGRPPSLLDLRRARSVLRVAMRRLERAFETGRILPYLITVIAAIAVLFAAIMRLVDSEDFPSFGVALWWAVSTVTTVGYGDVVPEEPVGRAVAAA
jgi:Ion channel